MSFQAEHIEKFQNLKVALAPENRDQIRLAANGGNTVLFVYPPADELEYIRKARESFKAVEFIDLRQCLVEFIDQVGWEDFKTFYQDYPGQPDAVFTDSEDDPKLEGLIIEKITKAIEEGKMPFLIHTGALYGTGIENIHIMQHPRVMRFDTPLVIFYPAIEKSETELDFLGVKPASKYRCKMVK